MMRTATDSSQQISGGGAEENNRAAIDGASIHHSGCYFRILRAAHAEPGLHSDLTAISGQGTGHVEVSPTGKDKPNFDVQVQVNVKDMLPNSTFTVQRTVDLTPDGVCTGTTWLTNGPITTSANGTGAQHFKVERGAPFVSGVRFDVEFRVIGNGTELRSDCMTVTVK